MARHHIRVYRLHQPVRQSRPVRRIRGGKSPTLQRAQKQAHIKASAYPGTYQAYIHGIQRRRQGLRGR